LPNRIKDALERGKKIDNEWNNNKWNILINDCLNIENNIRDIKYINENIKKCKTKKVKIKFKPEEDGINNFLEKIKSFGEVYHNSYKYAFRECPLNVKEERKFSITG
jgi:hypothetical protein